MADLDAEERALVDDLIRRFEAGAGWNEFENHAFGRIAALYDGRGVARAESLKTAVYRIAQDLGGRIGIKAGYVRMPDYRDELAVLIQRQFKSRREFCRRTGLSEDMLSHVLARRKHLSMESLTDALGRIGYTLQITPTHAAEAAEH
ncbi:MAG: hypothetical protein DWQ34_16470 [Planctomycetota bacterium]|nr:MAG: hypothetical protein DWQ29_22200 [Planctomycetota bacterium]REJ90814.1 MAG: hypothetical protein DWQ34_16470 [Planctomycetota bacterium]REK24286.1 MAG: hypothetical protein DWQ41_14755 [Planctomycetota bacterium]REK28729.1 MAG: hypothetical protein DWQ45_23765 [Planctomycetota bacterium]